MNVCIATIQNKAGSILKYRILDTDTKTVHEVHSRSIESELGRVSIRNLGIDGTSIRCTEGNIKDYPIVIQSDTKVKNNIPVVINISGDTIDIANYEGKIATLPISSMLQKISSFANADIVNGTVQLKKTTESTPIKASRDIGTVGATEGITGKNNQPTVYGKSALEQIMDAPPPTINIHGFIMSDHYTEFGISSDIYKKPSILFAPRIGTRQQAKNNPNEYSFEIVKFEDRVELRKFIGVGYKGAVTVPDNVTHICKEAFARAEATELNMPETIVYLGEYAFVSSKFKVIKLSTRITAIPLGCFKDSHVEEINLDNITSIDNMAFCNSSILEVRLKANIKQIGFEAFKDCTKLNIFEHNKTLEKIRHHAFYGCINLTLFDFESVTKIEQYAFSNTGIKRAKINGEVSYMQSDTFTGEIEEVEVLDGMVKISANSVSNTKNKPIKWTVPKSATNIEKGTFKEHDTVFCYRKSVAASAAIQEKATIVYLDDLNPNSIPNKIKKANMMDLSIEDILKDMLKSILDNESIDTKYDIDESKVIKVDIPQEILDLIGHGFSSEKYACDEDYEHENTKFKCILEHLSKVAALDISPFSKLIIKMKDTFNVAAKSGRLEELYFDGISAVYRITYVDNKFLSINSSFIVAKTYDTLRYICMDNKYTDIMCENHDIKDLDELFKVLRPGDTIGLNNIISDVRYDDIAYESPKKIQVTKGNMKRNVTIKMNMYQALRYSSVTIKIDNNNIVLLVPGNKKIIKCASLGKTVWQNEREDTYKSVQCTIESIEDIGEDTIFDYNSTYKAGNYGVLFKRLKSMKESEHQAYIDLYSHIYKAEQSMYKHAGDYAYVKSMKDIYDTDVRFMLKLFKTSLIEERKDDWLEASIGTTIVADAQAEFELSDGATIYQYRNVKKIALRNKLMSGGDRKLYIFELVDSSGIRIGVYISTYDIVTLVDMCIGLNTESKTVDKRIFVDKTNFDIVEGTDVIEVSVMCRESKLSTDGVAAQYIFAVYKPNGLSYLGLKIEYGKTFRFMPLIQIGELEVALEFIEDTNKYGTNNESMRYLYEGSVGALGHYFEKKLGRRMSTGYKQTVYLGILRARELCINGVSDIAEYNRIGIKEILKRCLGYSGIEDLYKKIDISKVATDNEDDEDDADYKEDIDFDIDEDELGLDFEDDDDEDDSEEEE